MKRLTIVLAFVFVFTAAFAHLEQTYSQKFFDITGRAKWIWAQHRMSDNEPVAFFATRDFDLPEQRYYTHLKILGDPEYSVFVNGREIAGRRVGEERALDLYDISDIVKTGRNRIVVGVRAPKGVGGLIASVDIAPETANWMVSDEQWRLYRNWDPRILARDIPGGWYAPLVIGDPPIGKWNYLSAKPAALTQPAATVIAPLESFQQIGSIPAIRTQGGVAVATADKQRATAFDFGFTRGRIRLTLEKPPIHSRLVNVRLANARGELAFAEWNLRRVVFAPGETVVTTPESYDFRYVMVFGRGVRAEVVR